MRPLPFAAPALLLLSLAAQALAAPPSSPLHSHARPPRHGVVLVALRAGTTLEDAPGGALRVREPALAAALGRFGLAHARRLVRGGSGAGRPEYFSLRSDAADFDPRAAAAALRAQPGVLAAAPDLNLSLHLVPNDPHLPTQWHLGTSVAAVRARPAWDLETGSPNVPIGIVDTGVDVAHPDLAAKIWHNLGEIPANGLDDDGNGYVDDVTGWDFGDGDADPSPTPMIDPVAGVDVGWHGTFVAGLAAAATNNGDGIAGVAWGCPVMPLKVADAAGDIPLSAVTEAVGYAIDNGASVLNFSLGTSDTTALAFFQPLMTAAFDAGIVCVASAGNDGVDTRSFPAACDSVLSVAATNSANNRADWSNWGDWVDIAAPGESVWSSIARNYVYDDVSQIFFEILWYWDTINPYMYNDGTSFSSPIVAGAAALVRSRFPALGPWQVQRQLVLNGDARTYDNPIGPRLNIEHALQAPLDAASAASAALAFSPPWPNPAAGTVRLAFTLPRAGRATLRVLDAQGRLVRTLLDGTLPAGAHAVTWDARDERGMAASPGLYFARIESAGVAGTRRIARVR
ncbi:MAG: S8 family serine peptidase [Candidatus Eisenbacteria bacterium]|nr:S8 family serine peptidase [Candidatus Eisenbacteria bacterium]